jgi:hypothetical protein
MHDAEARVAYVIRGVVEQAIRDAGARGLRLLEPVSPLSRLVARWTGVVLVDGGAALACSLLNKTELLLAGADQRADLYPLGDLYASELAAFAEVEPGPVVTALAAQAGGLRQLDAVLRSLLDERSDADTAFRLAPQLREPVLARLRVTRFRRAHLGIVPKLGARTIGIDLFI